MKNIWSSWRDELWVRIGSGLQFVVGRLLLYLYQWRLGLRWPYIIARPLVTAPSSVTATHQRHQSVFTTHPELSSPPLLSALFYLLELERGPGTHRVFSFIRTSVLKCHSRFDCSILYSLNLIINFLSKNYPPPSFINQPRFVTGRRPRNGNN